MLVDLQSFSKTKMKTVYGDDEENDANKTYGFCEINSEMRYETLKNDFEDSMASASSSSMASNERVNDSLLKLPFSVTLELMNSLDVDRGWEEVAAAAGFNFDQIQQLGFTLTQRSSPTRALLWKLGSLNYTVNDLYEILRIAERIREMQTLEAYVKEGGMKGAAAKPKSPQSSLSSLLSQIKESDKKSQGRMGSNCSLSGSELNFNQPSPVDKAKVIQSKNYEDKKIPGTHPSLCQPLMEKNANSSQSMSPERLNSSPTKLLRTDVCQSLPPFDVPFSQMQAERHRTDGIENIPISGQSFPTSSENKNFPSPSVASSSLNSEQRLNTSCSSQLGSADSKVSFSYRELFNATDGFSKNKILGEGAFGNVYRGTLNQQECAIKRLYSTATDSKKSDQVKSELSALLKYRHENIVALYGYAENESELCLVYQYMANGSLEDRLQRKNGTPSLNWERRLNILIGSCKGLNFLHTMGDTPLIHGDIKSANILLDQYFEAKLGDFGQAKYATSSSSTDTTGFTHITKAETTTKLFGTRAYLAPELISRGTQSIKSDIYALGVVFMEVCSGLKAYDQSRNDGTYLADHFRNEVADKGEHVWREQFQDRSLLNVPDNIFISVLKIASRCVNTTKKARPDTKKLLGEMKLMYIQNQDTTGADDGTFSSLSTSLQIDSRNTISSYYLSSNITSHLGGQDTNHVCGPGEQISIHQQLPKFQPPLPKLAEHLKAHVQEPPGQLQADVAVFPSPIPPKLTAELRNYPDVDNPSKSVPPVLPQSEAFLLQAAYDKQPQRKIIDRLSGVLQKEENVFDEYPSDPHKLQKIDTFDMKHQNNIPSHFTAYQKGNEEHDCFPQADPKKLAQLKAYDEADFGMSDHSAGDVACLDCDPLKLAYLQKFDDNLYKQSAEKESCNSNTQPMAFAATRQEPSGQIDNLMKTIRLTEGQAVVQGNTITGAPTCVPESIHHHTSPVQQENTAWYPRDRRDFDFKCTAEHNGNHWTGANSNNINAWSSDQNSVAKAQVTADKPMKQKMDLLFVKYSQLQSAGADDDDDDYDDDCNNKG